MKSTLFNTMLGCLAALSLAGCGGHNNDDAASSSSSSSSSVSGLLNPDDTYVKIVGEMSDLNTYDIRLYNNGNCTIRITDVSNTVSFYAFYGKWEDMTDSTEAFMIAFVKPFVTTAQNASVEPADTVRLTFPEGAMESYRAGHEVFNASFDKSPFTYKSGSTETTANYDSVNVLPHP
ncbi:MAG: hypothetical protein MSQ05_02510 [Akkermansia sp.]|nr:hypothetical protein [Akkermansia sp.]